MSQISFSFAKFKLQRILKLFCPTWVTIEIISKNAPIHKLKSALASHSLYTSWHTSRFMLTDLLGFLALDKGVNICPKNPKPFPARVSNFQNPKIKQIFYGKNKLNY